MTFRATMNNILVEVTTAYQKEHSACDSAHHVYTYTIQISNKGDSSAQLLSRHWIITDAQNQTQEVQGLGVVGEQPTIMPGSSYTYTSGVVLETPTGTMTGSYTMKNEHGDIFEAEIPVFYLVQPRSLH